MTNFTRAFARYYGIKPSEVRLQKPDMEFTTPTSEGRHNGREQTFADPIDGAHE
jgi:AraC-like DNA-binding protein